MALRRPARAQHLFVVDGAIAGRFDAERAARLADFDRVFARRGAGIEFARGVEGPRQRTEALEQVARTLAAEGRLTPWRGERYAVGPGRAAAPWFELERAAARYFGVRTYAAHVNGLHAAPPRAARQDAPELWFARRAAHKAIDPGLLDNLVAGGIAAGQSIAATVVKEAWEEAGIAAELAGRALPVGAVHVYREQPDGVQHETIFVHDLALPRDFSPTPTDGEVAEFRRVDLAAAARLIAQADGPDVVTADASLVVLDCLLRHGAIPADAGPYLALEALRHPAPEG